MDRKLKLAVIGTGMAWEKLHYPAIKKLNDKYEIKYICDIKIEKAKKIAEKINLPKDNIFLDYKEMLQKDDIDVVDVLVPISKNYNIAKDVLLSNKNLIAEKPFAATLEGAKELIKIKNEKSLKVMVAENFRYEECNQLIKKELTDKTIGDVLYFILNTGANFENEMKTDTFASREWRQHPNFKGGIFLDGGIHDIALMRFLFGDVNEVFSMGIKQNEDYCEYICINSLLKFNSNIIGNYSYFSKGVEHEKPPIGLRIFGTKGDIYLESKECGTIKVNKNNGSSSKIKFKTEMGYYNELLLFYNNKIIATPEKELGDIELVFKILEKL